MGCFHESLVNLWKKSTKYHNGAPSGLKALFKDVDKIGNERIQKNPKPIFNKHPGLIINMISQKIRKGRRKRIKLISNATN
jgi:hypothetical protein